MPIIINWAANVLFGWAAVMLARRSKELQQGALGWIMLLLISYESLIFTPIAVYLFRFYPYWSTHYLFDPDIYPRFYYWVFGFSALVVAGNYLLLIGTYLAARWLVLRNQLFLAWLPPLVALASIVVVVISYGSRLLRLADYYEYWGGGGSPILTQPAGLAGFGSLLGMVLILVFIRRLFRHTPSSGT